MKVFWNHAQLLQNPVNGVTTVKIAVSGKGGVGKTTFSASLVKYYLQQGYQVYAVDADPDVSLGTVLGLPEGVVDGLKPIVEMREIVANNTGGTGAFFSLNPDVEGLLNSYCYREGKLSFLKMGAVKQGGSACYCRENSVLNALIGTLLVRKQEVVVLDMGAGIEHLTRGTARGVDMMVIVTEPSRVSIHTAKVIQQLAGDIGVKHVGFVGNKVRNRKEEQFLYDHLPSDSLLGIIPFNENVLEYAMGITGVGPTGLFDVSGITHRIMREVGETEGL